MPRLLDLAADEHRLAPRKADADAGSRVLPPHLMVLRNAIELGPEPVGRQPTGGELTRPVSGHAASRRSIVGGINTLVRHHHPIVGAALTLADDVRPRVLADRPLPMSSREEYADRSR
jgi:hypothetical protein